MRSRERKLGLLIVGKLRGSFCHPVTALALLAEFLLMRIVFRVALHAFDPSDLESRCRGFRMAHVALKQLMQSLDRKSCPLGVIQLDLAKTDSGTVTALAFLAQLAPMRILMTIAAAQLAAAIHISFMTFAALLFLAQLGVKTQERKAGVFVVVEYQFLRSALKMTFCAFSIFVLPLMRFLVLVAILAFARLMPFELEGAFSPMTFSA